MARGERLLELIAEECRQKITYSAETGILRWLSRPAENYRQENWNRINAGKTVGCISTDGYVLFSIGIEGRPCTVSAHRAAWLLHYGAWPSGTIDHINHYRSDNRIKNLRDVSIKLNCQNRGLGANNKSGYLGVSFCTTRGVWVASYQDSGRSVYIGAFSDASQAGMAVKRARDLHGVHRNHGAPLVDQNI